MDKIAVFSNMYPSKEHPTFGIFVKNQVELLREANIDVDVIAIDNARKGKITTIQKYLSWFFRSFFYMAKNKKKLLLTHAHYAFPTGMLSLYGKKLFKIPYVVTVHGGDIDKMAKKNARIANWTRQLLQQANHVIVVGERLKEEVIQSFGVQPQSVTVMSMGVNTTIFHSKSREAMKKKCNVTAKQNILFVGNVIKEKGVEELIEAFDIIQRNALDTSLTIIGAERDTHFSSELRTKITALNLKNVSFIGPENQQELAEWMAASDVLALPSYHEGFGLVALEAMATALPVVGSDVGGLSYLLNDQAGILVEPKNVVSLAEGLAQALQNPAECIDVATMKKRVEEHSFHNILLHLQNIYATVKKG